MDISAVIYFYEMKSRYLSADAYLWEILGQWDILLFNLSPFLDVSSLIITTSAFVKKKNSKVRHLRKNS